MVYRFALSAEQAVVFDKLIRWVRKNSAQLPLTFLLGFYVSLVVKRWWEQYVKLPWPDEVATYLKVAISKNPKKEETEDPETEDNENLKIRRTIVRYCLLSYVLCLRRISSLVRKHYPDMDHLVTTRLMRKDEADLIGEEDPEDMQKHGGSNWWLPMKWSIDIIRKTQMDGRLANPPCYPALVGKVSDFRKSLTQVASYGHVTIPLVYTQVVHLAVYIHFAVNLVGDQWTIWRKDGDEDMDLYYPIFLTFKFLFYFGWLNVAETLYNPFGCDDEDFELIDLINRHIKVATTIVDEGNFPEIRDDEFWKPQEVNEGEDSEWVPNIEDRIGMGKQMDLKFKSIEDIVIDEKCGGNWRKTSFASRVESRDLGN
eukprot:GFUD01042683.1.p1 GENE.GFUD01042683.1~~GFUD01042683.1.p1  ORF type:complete len:370 (-),score=91.16 GFUD01042683.1:360-1469(-)